MAFLHTEFTASDLASLPLDPNELTLAAWGAKFQWAPCHYSFIDDNGVQHPAPSAETLKLVVRLERTPPATHDAAGIRYRWHKNCVLPRIRVSVQG